MKVRLCCFLAATLATGTVGALDGPYSVHNFELIRIDPSYQTTTLIGNGPHSVTAIEYSVDGFIYGVNPFVDTLERIDPATGLTETVGPLGVDLDWVADLDEDAHGQLWMLESFTGRLYTIDRTSGSADLHCQAVDPEIVGLASLNGTMFTTTYSYDPPSSPGCGLEYTDMLADNLEHGPDGWIHGMYRNHVGWHFTWFVYYRVHPTTGEYQELGRFGGGDTDSMWGLTFDPTELQLPPTIPVLDRRALMLMVVLLATAGILMLVRFGQRAV